MKLRYKYSELGARGTRDKLLQRLPSFSEQADQISSDVVTAQVNTADRFSYRSALVNRHSVSHAVTYDKNTRD